MIRGVDERAICYLSVGDDAGHWSPLVEARVPVLDRGFIFGDGIYEVIPVFDDCAFRLQQHLARLRRSLRETAIVNPLDDPGWTALVAALAEHNRELGGDLLVYLQITRGVARRDHGFPNGVHPTIFGMATRWVPPSDEQVERGIAAVTHDDIRWHRCDIKAISLLGNVLARQYAIDCGAAETILIRDGMLTEAAAANVWAVHDGVLRTPPTNHLLLEGVRMALLGELADEYGIPCEAAPLTRDDVLAADELILSSAGRELLAITSLDGWPVGTGMPGRVFRTLHAAYQKAKHDPRHCTPLRSK